MARSANLPLHNLKVDPEIRCHVFLTKTHKKLWLFQIPRNCVSLWGLAEMTSVSTPSRGGRHLWYCYDVIFSLKEILVNVRLFWDLTNVWVDYDMTPGGGVAYDVISASPLWSVDPWSGLIFDLLISLDPCYWSFDLVDLWTVIFRSN